MQINHLLSSAGSGRRQAMNAATVYAEVEPPGSNRTEAREKEQSFVTRVFSYKE